MSPTEDMDYDSMTVLKLKTLCKERGLRVSGNKSEVIIRLMENDEVGLAPVQTQIQSQGFPQHNPGGYIPPQMIYVKKENELANGIGICIIIYAIFRLFWAVIFSVGGLGGVGWILSPVAFLLGIGFMIGGAVTYSGYRNGINLTLGVLVVSGILSVIFHGDEVNPVSIAWGDSMFLTSIMCSISCMMIVGLPLLISPNLKSGWPEAIENLLGSSSDSSDKRKVNCQSCQAELQVPSNYSGQIECPTCQAIMNV